MKFFLVLCRYLFIIVLYYEMYPLNKGVNRGVLVSLVSNCGQGSRDGKSGKINESNAPAGRRYDRRSIGASGIGR